MSRRRKKYNNRYNNGKNMRSYNNFTTNSVYLTYLIMNENLREILNRVSSMNNEPISTRLLYDSENKTYTNKRVNWLNVTKSKLHISYCVPDDIKVDGDEWLKSNRKPTQIRKLIRKIYRKSFSNTQIKNFIGKFSMIYSIYTKEEISPSNKKNDKKLNTIKRIENIINKTANKKLKWEFGLKNAYSIKYITRYNISKNKNILIEYYESFNFDDFMVINMEINGKKKFLFNSFDGDDLTILKLYIKDYVTV